MGDYLRTVAFGKVGGTTVCQSVVDDGQVTISGCCVFNVGDPEGKGIAKLGIEFTYERTCLTKNRS